MCSVWESPAKANQRPDSHWPGVGLLSYERENTSRVLDTFLQWAETTWPSWAPHGWRGQSPGGKRQTAKGTASTM